MSRPRRNPCKVMIHSLLDKHASYIPFFDPFQNLLFSCHPPHVNPRVLHYIPPFLIVLHDETQSGSSADHLAVEKEIYDGKGPITDTDRRART